MSLVLRFPESKSSTDALMLGTALRAAIAKYRVHTVLFAYETGLVQPGEGNGADMKGGTYYEGWHGHRALGRPVEAKGGVPIIRAQMVPAVSPNA